MQCACNRCSDPTEFGTYTSALTCPQCVKKRPSNKKNDSDKVLTTGQLGFIISSDVKNLEANWKCTTCSFSLSSERVSALTLKIKEESIKLDDQCWTKSKNSDTIPNGGPSIQKHEEFLKKHENITLHPNHVLLIDKKYTLAKMYGRMVGYEADVLTEEQLKRKRKLCEEVLLIFDKIMPGRTRKRGNNLINSIHYCTIIINIIRPPLSVAIFLYCILYFKE